MANFIDAKKGFSLIEVTLALLVIGLGLLAVFGLFGGGLQMNTESQQETSAAFFSQQVMEGCAATNWVDLDVGFELPLFETETSVRAYSMDGNQEIAAVVLDSGYYKYTLERDSDDGAIAHQTILYRGDFEDLSDYRKSLTLYIWNNAYLEPAGAPGSFSPEPDATVYREFYNFN